MTDLTSNVRTAGIFRQILSGTSDERFVAAGSITDLARDFGADNVPSIAGALVVAFNSEQDERVRGQILYGILELATHHRTVPRAVVQPLLKLTESELGPADYDLVEGIDECISENEAAAERRSSSDE